MPKLDLHGGIAAYLYQPTNGWDPQLWIYSNLKLKAEWDFLGIYFEPRLTSEKMRPYYDSLAWIQQAYVSFRAGPVTLKAGKAYRQLGLFWDNTFYGNIHVYEGLKFNPSVGLSLEGSFGKETGVLTYLQYFVMDGHLNSSLLGRDTVSIPGAKQRNIIVARVQPFFRLAKKARLEFGLSGETFAAHLPAEDGSNEQSQVARVAADVKLSVGPFGLWGEVQQQFGKSVTAYPYPSDPTASPPVPGRSSASNTYLLAGTEFSIGPVTPRYTLSMARYRDVDVSEVLHLFGVGVTLHEHSSLLVEYALWDQLTPAARVVYDQSLNVTVMAYF